MSRGRSVFRLLLLLVVALVLIASPGEAVATSTAVRVSGDSPFAGCATAPYGTLYDNLGDYQGLAAGKDSFISFFVQAASGNRANRTDVFALPLVEPKPSYIDVHWERVTASVLSTPPGLS